MTLRRGNPRKRERGGVVLCGGHVVRMAVEGAFPTSSRHPTNQIGTESVLVLELG